LPSKSTEKGPREEKEEEEISRSEAGSLLSGRMKWLDGRMGRTLIAIGGITRGKNGGLE
jgi:hypothetical protein